MLRIYNYSVEETTSAYMAINDDGETTPLATPTDLMVLFCPHMQECSIIQILEADTTPSGTSLRKSSKKL
jgi:hypothetical protein